MPHYHYHYHYHFHVFDGEYVARDAIGRELADLKAAIAEAHESARELLIHRIKARQGVRDVKIDITDRSAAVLASVNIVDILE